MPGPEDFLTLVLTGWTTRGLAVLPAPWAARRRSPAPPICPPAAAASGVPDIAGSGGATLLRLEGFTPGLRARARPLTGLLGDGRDAPAGPRASAILWKEMADAAYFTGDPEPVVWKLSVPPTAAAGLGALADELGGRRFYDWGGGAAWLELPSGDDAHAARVRQALAAAVGDDGHATLMRAPDAVRAAQAVFQPPAPAVAALTARVKSAVRSPGPVQPRPDVIGL